RGGGGPGTEAIKGLRCGDPHANGADDSPPAGGGSEADRESTDDLDPRIDHEGAGTSMKRVDGERDHAHGLLAVVTTVTERHVRARDDLCPAEESVHEAIAHVPETPIEGEH